MAAGSGRGVGITVGAALSASGTACTSTARLALAAAAAWLDAAVFFATSTCAASFSMPPPLRGLAATTTLEATEGVRPADVPLWGSTAGRLITVRRGEATGTAAGCRWRAISGVATAGDPPGVGMRRGAAGAAFGVRKGDCIPPSRALDAAEEVSVAAASSRSTLDEDAGPATGVRRGEASCDGPPRTAALCSCGGGLAALQAGETHTRARLGVADVGSTSPKLDRSGASGAGDANTAPSPGASVASSATEGSTVTATSAAASWGAPAPSPSSTEGEAAGGGASGGEACATPGVPTTARGEAVSGRGSAAPDDSREMNTGGAFAPLLLLPRRSLELKALTRPDAPTPRSGVESREAGGEGTGAPLPVASPEVQAPTEPRPRCELKSPVTAHPASSSSLEARRRRSSSGVSTDASIETARTGAGSAMIGRVGDLASELPSPIGR